MHLCDARSRSLRTRVHETMPEGMAEVEDKAGHAATPCASSWIAGGPFGHRVPHAPPRQPRPTAKLWKEFSFPGQAPRSCLPKLPHAAVAALPGSRGTG
jgi:hypothetical protein